MLPASLNYELGLCRKPGNMYVCEVIVMHITDRIVKWELFVVTQDLGCGWGSLALWLCEHYPNCTVTTVSNSKTQREWIESEAQRKGFSSRINCITSDANVFNTSSRFDQIISIEMFEVRTVTCFTLSSTVFQSWSIFSIFQFWLYS